MGGLQAVTVDAGTGDDSISFGTTWDHGRATVTLGAGRDTITVASSTSTVFTDFVAGDAGDVIRLGYILQGWDGASNPFSQGYMRFVQTGADTLFQFDLNGGGNSYETGAILQNVTATSIISSNTGGYDSRGGVTLNGSPDADTLIGTRLNDSLSGFGGTICSRATLAMIV